MTETGSPQTTPRERVPCDDVAILAAYEAGRRDALDEAAAIIEPMCEAPDGMFYAQQAERIAGYCRCGERVLSALKRLVEDAA